MLEYKLSYGYNISDNREGMLAEVLQQAFNPFFTTRSVGSVTGVGLTIAERIGKIHEGEGTTVTFFLVILRNSLIPPWDRFL